MKYLKHINESNYPKNVSFTDGVKKIKNLGYDSFIKSELQTISDYTSKNNMDIVKITYKNDDDFIFTLNNIGDICSKEGMTRINIRFLNDIVDCILYIYKLKDEYFVVTTSMKFLNEFDDEGEYLVVARNYIADGFGEVVYLLKCFNIDSDTTNCKWPFYNQYVDRVITREIKVK